MKIVCSHFVTNDWLFSSLNDIFQIGEVSNNCFQLGIVDLVLSLCVHLKTIIYFYDFELKLLLHYFLKKRNSHSHLKYIKNHKSIPRKCCLCVITLCSPKKSLFLLNSNKSSSVLYIPFIRSVLLKCLHFLSLILCLWSDRKHFHQILQKNISEKSNKQCLSQNAMARTSFSKKIIKKWPNYHKSKETQKRFRLESSNNKNVVHIVVELSP